MFGLMYSDVLLELSDTGGFLLTRDWLTKRVKYDNWSARGSTFIPYSLREHQGELAILAFSPVAHYFHHKS